MRRNSNSSKSFRIRFASDNVSASIVGIRVYLQRLDLVVLLYFVIGVAAYRGCGMGHHDPRELAHILALKRGMALIIRQGVLYGIYQDGNTVRVCNVSQGKDFWIRVCLILTEDGHRFNPIMNPFLLTTPSGVYTGQTLFQVLKKVLCGKPEDVKHE